MYDDMNCGTYFWDRDQQAGLNPSYCYSRNEAMFDYGRGTYYSSDEDEDFDPRTCNDGEISYWQKMRAIGADYLQQTHAEYQAKTLEGTIECIGRGLDRDVTKKIEKIVYAKRQHESMCQDGQFVAKHNFVRCKVCGYHRCSRCNTKYIPMDGHPPTCSCRGWKLLFRGD